MTKQELHKIIQDIVQQANELKNKYIEDKKSPVNYACIFCQDQAEYNALLAAAQHIGNIIEQTPTGPLFHIQPLDTVAGQLKLLKIRQPDPTRPERGDADFTVINYQDFKNKYLAKAEFNLIKRKNFEMLELMDSKFSVRAYFSNPPLDQQLKI